MDSKAIYNRLVQDNLKRASEGSFGLGEFELRVVKELRTLGLRVTGSRLSVAKVLHDSPSALTAKEIHDLVVKSGHKTNLVSVYRILSTLTELGLAHRIGSADGYVACKLGEVHSNDTEHWVCSSCGNVTEVTVAQNMASATRDHLIAQGFSPSAIHIEIEGECRDCQSSAK